MPAFFRRLPFYLNYSTLFILALAFMIARCKKDPAGMNAPGKLTINFSETSINIAQVDSAIVSLTKGTSSIIKKMTIEDDALNADIADLNKGDWDATIRIYARIPNDINARRYDLVTSISIGEEKDGIIFSAPKGTLNDQWKPRVVLTADNGKAVLTVALDPRDPYTDFVVKTGNWDYAYVDRTATIKNADGTETTDGDGWECEGDCYEDGSFHFNSNAFLAFSQRMANKAWKRSEVYGFLMNVSTGEELNFYYLYNKM